MILIWGLPQDPSTRAAYDSLQRRQASVFFLNHAEIYDTTVSMSTRPRLSFTVTCGDRSCDLSECTAAYLRPYNYRDYPAPGDAAKSDPVLVHHLISAWAEHTPALVISRPSAEGTNQSKLYQAMAIRAAGFLTPETLVTNDGEAIREFGQLHGRLIYKSLSNVRSIVKELDLGEVEGRALGPAQFQDRVEGQNIRVHVAGEECFACAITSDETDYRYAESQMTPVELPAEVARKAVLLTRQLGLYLAGLDFVVTPAGDWYCLEANPNPAFACFTGAPEIADAVARMLLAADTSGNSFPATQTVAR